MRPSLVRSKSAPQRSSSSTRSGASWACSWAMRQLFSILPPRIVSRKWTCQLSSGQTLPRAAAIPPSAITVWALPRRDFVTRAVRAPWPWASTAARKPAPPAPITTTSYSCVSWRSMPVMADPLEEPQVADHAHGDEPDVEVGEADAPEGEPREEGVPLVEAGHDLPEAVAGGGLGEDVHAPAAQVPAGVAGEGMPREQRHVDPHDQRPHPDPDAVLEAEGLDRVPCEEPDDADGQVERVAVQVLEDEGEARLAGVAGPDVRHRAAGRGPPERAVVRLPVVVAGQPEETGRPEDEERGRDDADDRERGEPPEERERDVLAAGREAGGVERREVGLGVVVGVLEGGPRRVDDEEAQVGHDQGRLDPPEVPAGGALDADPPVGRRNPRRR